MSDSPTPTAPPSLPEFRPISFWRLASKELRETLRDRRTLITLFLMPLIVYPILSLLLQGFFVSSLPLNTENDEIQGETLGNDEYAFVFEKEEILNQIARDLNQGYISFKESQKDYELAQTPEPNEPQPRKIVTENLLTKHSLIWPDLGKSENVKQMVVEGQADLGVLTSFIENSDEERTGIEFTLLYVENDPRSLRALVLMESILDQINLLTYRNVIRAMGYPRGSVPALRINTEALNLESENRVGISIAAIIPLILTLMTITGAVYPAIDLTAGERERGTLESMIAAPIPRRRILLGKLIAIVSVAMLTAIVNLLGMSITLWVFRLDQQFLGEQGLTLAIAGRVLGLLILFAAFFSSVLLVITSFARSFKEGQAYLIPVVMVALAPSLMSLKPDLQLTGLWTVTPLVNIVLLSRDVLDGSAEWRNAAITVLSTAIYSLLALTLAAKFFGTASVLYGQDQGIGTLFKRPRQSTSTATISLAMLCLALLFPASFAWNGVMGRAAASAALDGYSADGSAVTFQLWLATLGLVLVFFLLPFCIASFHRVRFLSGFGVRATSATALLAGVLMGIGFGPLLLQAIAWSTQGMEWLQLSDETIKESLVQRGESHVRQIKSAHIGLLLFSMAIVPAVCEELFFRGLLFQSMRTVFKPWKTILATALLFGAFHLISAGGLTVSRFLPTTIMGVILGWVCYRSNSVIPGILLHAIHNAITVCFAYFRDDLVANNYITEQQKNVPIEALIVGAVCAITGILLLYFFSNPTPKKKTTVLETTPKPPSA